MALGTSETFRTLCVKGVSQSHQSLKDMKKTRENTETMTQKSRHSTRMENVLTPRWLFRYWTGAAESRLDFFGSNIEAKLRKDKSDFQGYSYINDTRDGARAEGLRATWEISFTELTGWPGFRNKTIRFPASLACGEQAKMYSPPKRVQALDRT